MGYDLHITRKTDWTDDETSGIPIDEWLNYINSDQELILTNGYEFKIGSESKFQNQIGYCEWNSHPTEKDSDRRPWFAYWEGDIYTKNPDESTIRKMIQIAEILNGKVQGDDGELYDEEFFLQSKKTQPDTVSTDRKYKNPWWKFW